ncbi:hypothetical protein HMPREF9626_0718 [Streptococcus parasanguinis F0405]|uniref:Lipoprotein n=1 Tax=Streptococcus parasanguinis F0405 TaxID=905067 RepID=E3CD68_STRPA|nr:hypothetical protein [Streptococcus parasanguinis]EFQ55343.1 hypothetical protein HMPREF9626_0718 [Streptococcus parasanguinis F0405]
MKKKIKWGLVLCSVLIPVCLSACKQGIVEKQGSSNKEVRKKSIEKTFILTRQDQLHHLIGMLRVVLNT